MAPVYVSPRKRLASPADPASAARPKRGRSHGAPQGAVGADLPSSPSHLVRATSIMPYWQALLRTLPVPPPQPVVAAEAINEARQHLAYGFPEAAAHHEVLQGLREGLVANSRQSDHQAALRGLHHWAHTWLHWGLDQTRGAAATAADTLRAQAPCMLHLLRQLRQAHGVATRWEAARAKSASPENLNSLGTQIVAHLDAWTEAVDAHVDDLDAQQILQALAHASSLAAAEEALPGLSMAAYGPPPQEWIDLHCVVSNALDMVRGAHHALSHATTPAEAASLQPWRSRLGSSLESARRLHEVTNNSLTLPDWPF